MDIVQQLKQFAAIVVFAHRSSNAQLAPREDMLRATLAAPPANIPADRAHNRDRAFREMPGRHRRK